MTTSFQLAGNKLHIAMKYQGASSIDNSQSLMATALPIANCQLPIATGGRCA